MNKILHIIFIIGLLLMLCGCVAEVRPGGYYYSQPYYYGYPTYRFYYYDYDYPHGSYYYRHKRH